MPRNISLHSTRGDKGFNFKSVKKSAKENTSQKWVILNLIKFSYTTAQKSRQKTLMFDKWGNSKNVLFPCVIYDSITFKWKSLIIIMICITMLWNHKSHDEIVNFYYYYLMYQVQPHDHTDNYSKILFLSEL